MCRPHRHRVHHRVYGHARELFLLFEGYAEAVESVDKRRVYLVEALGALGVFWCGVVAYGLKVDGRDVEVRPCGRLEGKPIAVGAKAEVEQPFRLAFLLGNEAYHIFRQSRRDDVGVYVGGESVFIFSRSGFGE